jgi:hypothetical protein
MTPRKKTNENLKLASRRNRTKGDLQLINYRISITPGKPGLTPSRGKIQNIHWLQTYQLVL